MRTTAVWCPNSRRAITFGDPRRVALVSLHIRLERDLQDTRRAHLKRLRIAHDRAGHRDVLAAIAAGNVAKECDFTLSQVYSADEAFVTGTLGGVTPVTRVDGRPIADGKAGTVTKEASDLYLNSVGAL